MIETKRLTLAPLSLEHTKDLFALWSNFNVIKYTRMPLLKTQEECREKINIFAGMNTRNKFICNFAVLFREKAVGICGFPPLGADENECGFYYQLAQEYWGKGFGYEAAGALLKHIITETGAAVIFADSVSVNPASLAILSRLGFQETHRQAGGFILNDTPLDVVHFKYKIK